MDCVVAGNLLVQLFLQSEPKLQLNNIKLQCLLCIAQFSRLSYNETLFDENMRVLKYGVGLDSVADTFIYNSDIVKGVCYNKPVEQDKASFVLPFNKKKIYAVREELAEEDIALLKETFVAFGAYDENALRKVLGELVQPESLSLFSYLSVSDASNILSRALDSGQVSENALTEFIRKEHARKSEELKAVSNISDNIVEVTSVPVVDEVQDTIGSDIVSKDATSSGLGSDGEDKADDVGLEEKRVDYDFVRKSNTLKRVLSSETVVADKACCVYVEVDSNKTVTDVIVFAVAKNQRIFGKLDKLNDTIYKYYFQSVASDVKVSVVLEDTVSC